MLCHLGQVLNLSKKFNELYSLPYLIPEAASEMLVKPFDSFKSQGGIFYLAVLVVWISDTYRNREVNVAYKNWCRI